jgi:hypothetical protein
MVSSGKKEWSLFFSKLFLQHIQIGVDYMLIIIQLYALILYSLLYITTMT